MLRISFVTTLLVLIIISTLTCQVFAQPQRDSYDLFEIEYNWLEIEDVGEPLVNIRNNEFYGPFRIGYPFQFYGQICEQFWISSNGFIGFGPIEGYNNFQNEAFPSDNAPNNIIALYWTNLDPSAFWADGVILEGVRNGKRVIQYQGIGERNDDGRAPQNTITMQIILEPDGNIVFQYRDIGENFNLDAGTIGIENRDGSEGLTLRNNGEGIEIANETALLISTHGPGSFLIWDATAETESGNAQETALRALGHTVAHLRFLNGDGDPLPDDLREYEAVFVNLGNFGINGVHYHPLTEAEGRTLAAYIEAGGAVYLEGSDTWNNDNATDAHPFFHINGIGDGESLEPPVMGQDDTFAEGLRFNDYQARHNSFVDHLDAIDDADVIFTFIENDEEFAGMVAFWGEEYRTIGCSFEFGGLVDGEQGTKEDLMQLMIDFFRAPPPEFPPPLNLVALAGDSEVTLHWDHPRRAERIPGRDVLDLQREIARLSQPKSGLKPSQADRSQIIRLKDQLAMALQDMEEAPQRDELESFHIFMNGEGYAFTNAHELTVIELDNNQLYVFAVTAVYTNPNGESAIAGPVFAVPTAMVGPGWSQGFEQFNGALNPIPGQNGWEWGDPEEIEAHGGQNVWGTLIDRPYPNLADFKLYLPLMNLENVEERIWLSFFHYLDVEGGWDGCQVQISTDRGERWSLLTPFGGYPADDIFALNGGSGYTGTFEGWEQAVFDLGDYIGQVVQIRLNFRSDDSNFRPYKGWFIDDIALQEPELGSLIVSVFDDLNERPLANVEVELENFRIVFTDNNGQARFNEVPTAGNPWQLHLRFPGFIQIDSEVNIQANEVVIPPDFFMEQWDSDINAIPEEFIINMNFGEQLQRPLTLINAGQSLTNFDVYIDYFIGQNFNALQEDIPQTGIIAGNNPQRDDPWDLIQTYDLSAETGEQFFIGAQFVRTDVGNLQGPNYYRLVASAGDFQSGDCRFYQYNRDGTFEGHVPQNFFRIAGWGLRDLAYDGEFVYGSVDGRIYEMDPVTGRNSDDFIGAPLDVNRAIAYVPDDDAFWVGNWDAGWFEVDRRGNILKQNMQHGLTGVTGMAWNPSDPDGAFLYIHNQESENGGAAVYRYNPATRELNRQMETAAEGEGFAGGLFVTYLYDTHSWVMGALIQGDDGDVVKVYELWSHQSWISLTPINGALEGGAQTELTVSFDSRNIFDEVRFAQIEIVDRMTGEIQQVHCELAVEGGAASLDGIVILDDEMGDPEASTIILTRLDVVSEPIQAIPDVDGMFDFPRLTPGDYILDVTLDGYIPYVSDLIQLEPNEAIQNMEVILFPEEAGTLAGVVTSVYLVDGENQILQGVEIIAQSLGEGREIYTQMTDVNGEYLFELPAGAYDVTAYRRGWARMTIDDVVVRDNEQTELNFEMDDRGNIRAVHTSGNYDDRINIHWLPPGLRGDFSTIQMHSGVVANGIYLQENNDIIATRFEPEGQYDISRLDLYTIRRGDPVGGANGWPDGTLHNYRMYIFSEDPETGLPGAEIFNRLIISNMRNRNIGWDTLNTFDNPSLRFMEGPFYFGWSQDPAWGDDAAGLDESYDNPGTSFIRFSGEWQHYDRIPGDQIAGVIIWSQFEGEQRVLRRHARPIAGVNEDIPDDRINSIVLLNPAFPGSRVPNVPFDWERGYNQYNDRNPQRDDISGFMVYIHDGENRIPAFEDLLAPNIFGWIHNINAEGEDNENTEFTYSVGTIFPNPENPEEFEEFAGIEVTGMANMAPDVVRRLDVETDGLAFTVTWQAPLLNKDFSQCVDYAGCEIFLDGELIATVNDPEVFSWEGELQGGQEGWHSISLVAFDEVPNRSLQESVFIPLGQAVVFDFENNTPVFNAEPRVNGWSRSDFLNNGPGEAHSGDFAFATQPRGGQYENNIIWTITTIPEFLVESEAGRLDFYYFLESETGHDGGQVQISANGGDWELIEPVGDYPDQTVAGLRNTPGFSGRTNGWELATFDLSEYENALVRFKWIFASDQLICNYPGWYIDDIVFWGCSIPEYARISGTVRNQDGQAVSNASVTNGREKVLTNFNGVYLLNYTLPGDVTLTITKAGHHPTIIQENFEPGEARVVNAALIQARISANPDALEFALGGNDRLDVEVNLRNETNLETPFWIRVQSNPGLMRDGNNGRAVRSLSGRAPERDDPWDIAFGWNATQRSRFHRIMGAEFAEDRFFLSCADPVAGPIISVLDWEGNYIRFFNQPVEIAGWGLRDLAWDGEVLYASQNNRIYGFTTQGALQSEQAGAPIQLNRALAYDSEVDGFWSAEWSSDWYLVNRAGEVQQRWNGHGLTGIYGFAYHPDDPDGMFLYALNLEQNGVTGIYRANPVEGTIERIHQLAGAPTGCFITGAWDEDRWILGAVTGTGDQQMTGFELNRRYGFLSVEPSSGIIEPAGEIPITVSVHVPADAEEGDEYTGELSVLAFSGEAVSIPFTANIIVGFQHFDDPPVTNDFHQINIEEVTFGMRGLPVGSEIAVFTPRDQIGGVHRWLMPPGELLAYQAENGFEQGDLFRFVIWVPDTDQEYEPEVQIVEGPGIFRVRGETTVHLSVELPDEQVVNLVARWNLNSIYINPIEPMVSDVLGEINDRGHLVLVKDGLGRFWVPAHNFSNLREWDPLGGYQINVSIAESFTVIGDRVPPETPIQLNLGWNTISYLLDEEVDSRIAFSRIIDQILIAKDGLGRFMVPAFGFYGLGNLVPGQGYKVKVSEDVELVYNPGDGGLNQLGTLPLDGNLQPTGSDMSLLVTEIEGVTPESGYEILVTSAQNGRLIGHGYFNSEPCGIILRGDDPTTDMIDGAADGENWVVTLIVKGTEIKLQTEVLIGNDTYSTDGFSVIRSDILRASTPETFVIDKIYPNPFNSRTTVHFGIPEKTRLSGNVVNLKGQTVANIPTQEYSAGWHTLAIDANNWSSGIYVLNISTPTGNYARKLMLIQ